MILRYGWGGGRGEEKRRGVRVWLGLLMNSALLCFVQREERGRGSKDRGSVGGEREWHESVFFEAGHGIEVSE